MAEPVPDGPSVGELVKIAREFGVVVMAGLVERDAARRCYNTYVTVGPDEAYGERREEKENKRTGSYEQSYGSFYRSFILPAAVKAGEAKADVEALIDGTLDTNAILSGKLKPPTEREVLGA